MSLLSFGIDKKLASLPSTPYKPYLFRINDALRRENSEAYEPEIVAIGPYHRGKVKLQMMEEHKLLYLQEFLKRRNESSVDRYVIAMRELEKEARKCYAEPIEMKSDEFVKMMLLDGSFIIELFRKISGGVHEQIDDLIFQLNVIGHNIWRDLLLFENQIPFFVLSKLFDMNKDPNQGDPKDNIFDLVLNFSLQGVPDSSYFKPAEIPQNNVNHLLGLVHDTWCSSFAKMVDANQKKEWNFIKCTTELREAGIKFEKAKKSCSLLDINFEHGIMKIPHLNVDVNTQSFFRNLMAFEEYNGRTEPNYVIDYAKVIDCLINFPKDAEKLRHYEIIGNWLGDDKVVSTLFNKLGNQITINSATFCYSKVFNKVNKYCDRRRHTWMAKLKHNYFNSPWSTISVVGAGVLLILTAIQTVYSILQV